MTKFTRKAKYPIFGPFFDLNLEKNEFSNKLGLRHFLASIVP